MPAWSPEIANRFIVLASADGRALDQIQLQKLVYVAHGWCLAISGEPLTGDRPEAWEFGPVYRRLADALLACGLEPVTNQLAEGAREESTTSDQKDAPDLDELELDVIARIYHDYGAFSGSQLSNLTRRGNAPWREIYADGRGKYREIPHRLIRAQFVQLANRRSDRADFA